MRIAGAAILIAAAQPVTASVTAQEVQAQTPRAQPAVRGVEDPRRFVEQVYARYRAAPGVPPEDLVHSYSDRLRALFTAYDAWQARHQDLVGSVAFDWWTNSQDWGELNIRELGEERRGPDRRTIAVRFLNYDVESTNRFHFVRRGGRWFLDDVVNGSGSGENGWTLSALLRERPE